VIKPDFLFDRDRRLCLHPTTVLISHPDCAAQQRREMSGHRGDDRYARLLDRDILREMPQCTEWVPGNPVLGYPRKSLADPYLGNAELASERQSGMSDEFAGNRSSPAHRVIPDSGNG
jgi:hypothetical protein